MIYVIMGVSGCGKSSVGTQLAEKLQLPFFDADDYHPQSNVDKMSAGIALTDEDRWPWLQKLNSEMQQWQQNGGAVLACSALKQAYRDCLADNLAQAVTFVFLKGDFATLLSRLESRTGHFMKSDLLMSQLATLEEPEHALVIDINQSLEAIVQNIIKEI
ncbi:6-phosphogluconate dehydrogenase [Catenovulum agarivorans DS-2]|uniref:Gluconokinase n=1 Tax=Catenovulum agarivorans DS-2 TaxID=1328313 RepID=W7QJV5_9ALTE|nr:gluconokinase [Catenovulum agarivorans]EWH08418.1 6-phosphogluconate dehydrogenase [Catenovulum agarivorans DS-2]